MMLQNRRAAVLTALWISIIAVTTTLAWHAAVTERPIAGSCRGCNVILISIDTLRADHLGCYGYGRNTSPNIDQLSKEAVVFKNAISQSSWTAPAHASMMTGLSPSEHGLIFFRSPGKIRKKTPTLAQLLGQNGYRTAGFTGGGYVSNHFGIGKGFDVYRSMSRSFRLNIQKAEQWMRNNDDVPFFLFLHGYDVHRPYDKSEYNRFYDYEGEFDIVKFCADKDHRKVEGDELEYVISQYDAGILYTDTLLGKFFSFLKRRGIYDRSVIIVTSDHGDEFFEHGECDHKHSLYQELTHVPLIIKLPSNLERDVQWRVPASTAILPTVADLLGIPQTINTKHSLVRWLEAGGPKKPAAIVSETGYDVNEKWKYQKSLTRGNAKLILTHKKGKSSFEHYRLDRDPLEKRNLYRKRLRKLKKMKAALLSTGYAATLDAKPPEKKPKKTQKRIDPELLKQLEALGYMSD